MEIKIKYPERKCAYCGQVFKKKHNRQIYCSDKCRYEANKEKDRIRHIRYYHKNKNRINQTKIGTRTIGSKRNPDTKRESEIIQNEIERIGLTLAFF
jgi:predicted nucleic acid-binding Zn ribbon protein